MESMRNKNGIETCLTSGVMTEQKVLDECKNHCNNSS